MLNKVSLCMVVHSHQPVGNFGGVIEQAFQKSYRPFLDVLSRHPQIRVGLHYSGSLLQWLEAHHPEFLSQLRDLSDRGQVEHIGGGFYEPILVSIPDAEKIAQVRRHSEFLRRRFGTAPRGVWVTERVWDQSLILPLVEAGARYTILDDTHFLAAGLVPAALHQAYLTEESASPLLLAPSLQALRYTIPYRDPEETVSMMRSEAGQPPALFAVGDDCEKFGVWPGTYEHCYVNGWLDRFFTALEGAADWLEVVTLSDYLEKHPATSRVYLPTASYAEMMSWALPADVAADLQECLDDTQHMPHGERFRRFLRGGQWRNFLAKYPESNQMQKLVVRACRRWHDLQRDVPPGSADCRMLDEALDHLLAAQCNDAYWHGVFGGLYAPHLRSGILRRLIRAEEILDRAERADAKLPLQVCAEDFDMDGSQEVLLDQPCLNLVARPADGGTISSLRFKPAGVELINSLARRREAYHRLVSQDAGGSAASSQLTSIHERSYSKDVNLAAMLRYDRYARHSFRAYLFPRGKGWQDFDSLQLDECGELAAGSWDLTQAVSETGYFELRKFIPADRDGGRGSVRAVKSFTNREGGSACAVGCDLSVSRADGIETEPARMGIEMVFNLLAPSSPNHYFLSGTDRHPLEFRGELAGSRLSLIDEQQRIEITLEAPRAAAWWVVPIETVSQSESGFERIYQGSAIMPIWDIDRELSCALRVQVAMRS